MRPLNHLLFWVIMICVIMFGLLYLGIAIDSILGPRSTLKDLETGVASVPSSEEQIKAQIRNLLAENPSVRFDQLQTALAHPSEAIRHQAILAMKYDFSSDAIEYLCDRAVHDPAPNIRNLCLQYVVKKEQDRALPLVVALLTDSSENVRETALLELAQQKPSNLSNRIITECEEAGRSPTRGEIVALGLLGGDDAVAFLLKTVLQSSICSGSAIKALSAHGDAALNLIHQLPKNDLTQDQLVYLILLLSEIHSGVAKAVSEELLTRLNEPIRRNTEELLKDPVYQAEATVNRETRGSATR